MDVQNLPTDYIEEVMNKTFPGLQMFVRDVNLTATQASWYVPGLIIREHAYTWASYRVMGMVTTHRIAILSNHMYEVDEGVNAADVEGWGLCVAQPGSRFKVLDVYEAEGKTQILLLHLPDDDDWHLFETVVVNLEDEFIATSRERFNNKRGAEVVPALASPRWLRQVAWPIGFMADGTPQVLEDPPTAEVFFNEEDHAWIAGIAQQWEGKAAADLFDGNEELANTCAQLACYVLENDTYCFEQELERDMVQTQRNSAHPVFARLMLCGLEFGVARRDGACANFLGALYYQGQVVTQDYGRAKELYELAERTGVFQAMINLGYIYEYGRTGEPDYGRAFEQYAKVVALSNHPEALYKLGDMYARGQAVTHDLHMAYCLYHRSFEEAEGDVAQSQAAMRMATLISDEHNAYWNIPYNPMVALELYQVAERGLRQSIAQGETYYAKRLQEALEGQERMREILGEQGF